MAVFQLLLGASIAAAPAPAGQPQSLAAQPRYPALWVINDQDTVIYLFGTFHALDGRTDWFGQAVKTAFGESDQLILETLVPKPAAGPAIPVGEFSIRRGREPSMRVSQLGPSTFLDDSKAVMKAGRSKGLSTAHGADAVLRDAAESSGKPVAGLESFQFQMNMFRSLPPAAQGPTLKRDPKAAEALAAMLEYLKTAWSRGDSDSFAPMLAQMRSQSPQVYKTMFADRNSRWAHWIAQRLQAPGTVFVAVGAGHLSGPDSVQAKLGGLGVKSARVN